MRHGEGLNIYRKEEVCPLETIPIPPGVNRAQRRDSDPALNNTLLMQVLCNTNLQLAWKQVKCNHGAAGVDGITIEQYSEWIRPQWKSIRQQLLSGDYQPAPVKRVRIPKDDGTQRLLGCLLYTSDAADE